MLARRRPASVSKLPLVLAASLRPHGDKSACSDAASPGNSGGTFRIPAFSLRRSHTLDRPVCSTHRGLDSLEPTTARTPFDSSVLFYEASHLTASLFLGEERRRRGGKCSRTESCQCSISVAAFWGELRQAEVTHAAFLLFFSPPPPLSAWLENFGCHRSFQTKLTLFWIEQHHLKGHKVLDGTHLFF